MLIWGIKRGGFDALAQENYNCYSIHYYEKQ